MILLLYSNVILLCKTKRQSYPTFFINRFINSAEAGRSRSIEEDDDIEIQLAGPSPRQLRYHVTSDTLGREFDPGKRDFSH